MLDCSIPATNELIDRGNSHGELYLVRDRSSYNEDLNENNEREEETPKRKPAKVRRSDEGRRDGPGHHERRETKRTRERGDTVGTAGISGRNRDLERFETKARRG